MLYNSKIKDDLEMVDDICKELNKLVNNKLYIDPKFTYMGSKEKGYYTIYNKNSTYKRKEFNLNFRLYYPDKSYISYSKEAKNLKNKDLKKYIEEEYKKCKILYTYIEWFSVNPKRKGIGSDFLYPFINLLKDINTMEFILLTPINNDAKRFWVKNKFIDEDISMCMDKRIRSTARKRLIYKLN